MKPKNKKGSALILAVAKEARQKAQFITLTIATEAFKNDHGYYPESYYSSNDYCGAQILAEAIVGWDMFGFHSETNWESDGDFQASSTVGNSYDDNRNNYDLSGRTSPYVEVEKANAMKLNTISGQGDGLYTSSGTLSGTLSSRYVLTDTFERKYTFDIDNDGDADSVKSGMPILYFKARPNMLGLNSSNEDLSTYDFRHNSELIINSNAPWDSSKVHELDFDMFYNVDDEDYIVNKSITTLPDIPYNKDSFILISAGKDGLYGTNDDIFNFDKN